MFLWNCSIIAETAWSDAEDSRLLGLALDGDLDNLSCRTIRDMSSSRRWVKDCWIE